MYSCELILGWGGDSNAKGERRRQAEDHRDAVSADPG